MLRITVNKSAAGAKQYYSEHNYSEGRSLDDYYTGKDQFMGVWHGKGAERLGLTGDIDKNDFASLCDNLNPQTGKQLTAQNKLERRVGYDFTFDAGKSVSLAYNFGTEQDKKEILDAFRQSVKETMAEIETGMQTRVRGNKQNENRETGNLAYGEFIHFTTRPIEGVPDPQLHAHCFAFNATYDNQEQKWKAGQFGQIKGEASYYEAVFHSHLAERLQSFGYGIEKTKNGFEIQGIDRKTIDKFSNRTKEIDQLAEKENITSLKQKSNLGAKNRKSKSTSLSAGEITTNWNNRLTDEEKQSFGKLRNQKLADEKKKENEAAKEAILYSISHHLERKSIATNKEILTTAIKHAIGETSAENVKQSFYSDTSILKIKESQQTFITTTAALQEENELIAKAYASKGSFKPLYDSYEPNNKDLSEEQCKAVQHALTESDGITIIAGKAGTGKTTLMKEVQAGINQAGKQLFAFAPSAEASRMVQRKEGFENATTVAALIQNKQLQEATKGSVIWIDEAGMLSNKDMNRVLDIASAQNARVILTGDTKQHNSVERGDALRILQTEAGIAPVQVNKIQRQKNEQYKQAVGFLGKADVAKGFEKLDKSGAIHQIEDHEERINRIADDYYSSTSNGLKKSKKQKEVLVVSPTHAEGDKVTAKIREKLKEKRILSFAENQFTTFKNLQLTEAEKTDRNNYTADRWLIFHQNCKGFKAGSRYQITGNNDNGITLSDRNGKFYSLTTDKASHYHLYEPKSLNISQGEKIRITGNGKSLDGKHLFNGTMFKVNGFDSKGNIKLSNGSTISKDYGYFAFGYVTTSHAAQGKTVDKVIISQSAMSFRASSKEQFYVSVSRGRKAVSIYTDDKQELLSAVKQSNERRSARELTRKDSLMNNAVSINRNNVLKKIKDKAQQAAQKVKASFNKQISNNYELYRQTRAKDTGKDR